MHIYFLCETYFLLRYEDNDIICLVKPLKRSNHPNRYLTGTAQGEWKRQTFWNNIIFNLMGGQIYLTRYILCAYILFYTQWFTPYKISPRRRMYWMYECAFLIFQLRRFLFQKFPTFLCQDIFIRRMFTPNFISKNFLPKFLTPLSR